MTEQPGISPADFATFLRVMDEVAVLPKDHPQHTAARRATSGLFKAAKKHRRVEKRRILVGTGTTALELVRVQPQGKKEMAGADWGRGLRDAAVRFA